MENIYQNPLLITESGNILLRIQIQGKFYWAKHCIKKNTHIGDNASDNEWAAYCKLRKFGISQIPFAHKLTFLGQEWLITSEASGKRLLDIPCPNEIDDAIFSFIKDLSSIHSEYFGSITTKGPHFDSEYMLMRCMFEKRCLFLQNEYSVIRNLLDNFLVSGTFTNYPVFVIFDLWKGNLFWSCHKKRLTIIDLERCLFTDACAEGASLLGLISPEILESRLCNNNPKIIAKMYLYRALFLLERIETCNDQNQTDFLRLELTKILDKCSI